MKYNIFYNIHVFLYLGILLLANILLRQQHTLPEQQNSLTIRWDSLAFQ